MYCYAADAKSLIFARLAAFWAVDLLVTMGVVVLVATVMEKIGLALQPRRRLCTSISWVFRLPAATDRRM